MTNRQSLIQCSECGQTIEAGLCDACATRLSDTTDRRIRDLETALATERERADKLVKRGEYFVKRFNEERQRADHAEAAAAALREAIEFYIDHSISCPVWRSDKVNLDDRRCTCRVKEILRFFLWTSPMSKVSWQADRALVLRTRAPLQPVSGDLAR